MTLVQDEISAAVAFFGATAALTWGVNVVKAGRSRVVLAALATTAGLAAVAVLAEYGNVGFAIGK